MSSTVQVKTRIIVKTFRSHECNEGRENSIRLRFPIEIPKSNRDAFLLPCTSSISSLQRFLRRRGRNQRAYLRNINAGWLETRRVSARERCTYVCTYIRARRSPPPPPVESGANKEERGVLAAINRHRATIIIDTRCPRNESIYTAVYRYVILSGLSS